MLLPARNDQLHSRAIYRCGPAGEVPASRHGMFANTEMQVSAGSIVRLEVAGSLAAHLACSGVVQRRVKAQEIAMSKTAAVVFLFDVDNTLVDNDLVQSHLKEHLADAYGASARDRYWDILEGLRNELGYVDYLGALERFRVEEMHRPDVLRISNWLVDYPFADRLYPGALDVVKHVQQWGPAVILSDGDAVFQPRKVERSGLWRAVDDRVLIYIHKECELEYVERLYPANHYVLVDDKLSILAAVKKIWGERVTTVFPKQGHYAFDRRILAENPPADIELVKIGDLLNCDLAAFLKKQ